MNQSCMGVFSCEITSNESSQNSLLLLSSLEGIIILLMHVTVVLY